MYLVYCALYLLYVCEGAYKYVSRVRRGMFYGIDKVMACHDGEQQRQRQQTKARKGMK